MRVLKGEWGATAGEAGSRVRAKVSENELVRVSQPGILTISHVLNGKAAHPLTTYHGQQINQPAAAHSPYLCLLGFQL